MCGLGAIVRVGGGSIPEPWIDALDARIAYRGPDGAGRFRDRVNAARGAVEVALVHRRLSIIDLAGGAQPIVADRGGADLVAAVFNGCIYNHRRLRRELEALGHDFATDHSDGEVLVHGHRAWGEDLTRHVEGMYAFVIWDRRSGTLHAARDWFGEKPLYAATATIDGDEVTCYASDARAVADVLRAAMPGAARDDPAERRRRVAAYLQLGYAWEGRTLLVGAGADVRAVPPGLPPAITASAPDGSAPTRVRDPRAFARAVERLIERAVQERLEADVPLGCFLSGGVDSSLVALFAARQVPALRTFSVRMPDDRYDESRHAAAVAALLGTDHATLDVAARPAEDLVALVGRLGQPFGDSSILPTHWVSRAARAHVKVALAGDGADELFFGYDRYGAAPALRRLRAALALLPPHLGARAHPKAFPHRLGRLGAMARDAAACGVLAMESLFTQAQIALLLGGPVDDPPAAPFTRDARAALRMADVRTYLPGDLLTKVDLASMAAALEVRAPYLDRALAEAVLAAPPALLLRGGRKGLLRSIARRHLPRAAVDRPKMGFAIPVSEWFRRDFGGLGTLLRDHLGSADPFPGLPIDGAAARAFVREHERGIDHGQRLFALLTLSIWARA